MGDHDDGSPGKSLMQGREQLSGLIDAEVCCRLIEQDDLVAACQGARYGELAALPAGQLVPAGTNARFEAFGLCCQPVRKPDLRQNRFQLGIAALLVVIDSQHQVPANRRVEEVRFLRAPRHRRQVCLLQIQQVAVGIDSLQRSRACRQRAEQGGEQCGFP